MGIQVNLAENKQNQDTKQMLPKFLWQDRKLLLAYVLGAQRIQRKRPCNSNPRKLLQVQKFKTHHAHEKLKQPEDWEFNQIITVRRANFQALLDER